MTSKWIIKQIVNGKSVESSTEQAKFHFNLIIIMWTIKQAEETFRNQIPWKFNFYRVINSPQNFSMISLPTAAPRRYQHPMLT